MRKQQTLLTAISLAVILVVVLSIRGWQGDSGTVSQDTSSEAHTSAEENEHDHDHDHDVADSSSHSELDKKAMEAAEMVRSAESAADVMQAVQLLRSNLNTDSNHVGSIELLAELSIQSGQLEKAYQRYEKLVSLQPENQGYQERLKELCKQLGRSDC